MDNPERIRQLLRKIQAAEKTLDGLRAELVRIVAEEVGEPVAVVRKLAPLAALNSQLYSSDLIDFFNR